MQKLLSVIIGFIFILSTLNTSFANGWYIEDLLDLKYGPEEYDITLANLGYKSFRTQEARDYYAEVQQTNRALQDAIMQAYRTDSLDYYTTQGVISAHKKFVYHLNELFDGISMKESGANYGELDDYILDNYKLSRVYHQKVRKLINAAY